MEPSQHKRPDRLPHDAHRTRIVRFDAPHRPVSRPNVLRRNSDRRRGEDE